MSRTKCEYNWQNTGRQVFYDGVTFETLLAMYPFHFVDDFEGSVIKTVGSGIAGWTVKDTSAGGTAAPAIVGDASNGIVSLNLDATNEKQESGLYMADSLHINLDYGPIVEIRAAVHTAATGQAEMYFGLSNNYVEGPIVEADAGPTVHAFFVFDGGLACTIHTDDASTDKDAIATGITAVLDTYNIYRIDFTDITSVKFFIDGARVGSGTTFDMSNSSNVVTQPFMMLHKETGTGVGSLYIDYIKIWSNRA